MQMEGVWLCQRIIYLYKQYILVTKAYKIICGFYIHLFPSIHVWKEMVEIISKKMISENRNFFSSNTAWN